MLTEKPIMVIDDDMIDALTVKRAFKDNKITNTIITREDGEAALEYLRDAGNDKPAFILLDINMPRMNGLEFLRELRSDADLALIPVIVLTTSRSERDIAEAYKLGIAGYMIKSVNYADFVHVIATIRQYWEFSEIPDV